MNNVSLISFLCIAAIGSYLQAFTGFALGIFVLGAVVVFKIVPLGTTATAINIMTLVNTALALRGNLGNVDRKLFLHTLIGVLPGVPFGLWLLTALTNHDSRMLQIALGVLVLLTGAMLFFRPQPRSAASSSRSFVLAGGIGGILGGLFSVPGPPIIYHFYVQPLALDRIRLTLLGIFGTVSLVRLAILLSDGGIDSNSVWLGMLALPVVIITTALFIRFPPRLSDTTIRRAAFLLLSAMGCSIVLMGWL